QAVARAGQGASGLTRPTADSSAVDPPARRLWIRVPTGGFSMLERILVPLDGSEFADAAIATVRWLAKADAAEVLLVRVMTADDADGKVLEDAREHLRVRREGLQADGV